MFFLISLGSPVSKASMISDAVLIFLPLRTLRQLKNQHHLRRRLQFIFAASALMTCASIVSGIFNLCNMGFGFTVAIGIEVSHMFYLPSLRPSNTLLPFSWTMTVLLISFFTLSTGTELGLAHSLQLYRSRQRLLQTHRQVFQHHTSWNNILHCW
jgi:hypothetical protein